MSTTRSRRHLVVPDPSSAALEAPGRPRRSRLPAVLTTSGFVLGTLAAGFVVASLLGEPVLRSSWSSVGWHTQTPWWTTFGFLRDPGVVLASMTVGGLPGTLVGRTLAVQRLRRDRLEAWLDDRTG